MDIKDKIKENKFLRTFKDLFRRPWTVFENSTLYLNHWKFTLSLGGSLILLDSLQIFSSNPFEGFYGRDNEYISARISDYLEAQDNFYNSAGLQLDLAQAGLPLILLTLIFFAKARNEWRRFIAMIVYLLGILFFIALFPEILGSALSIQIPEALIDILVFSYLLYCFIAFFGNKVGVYVKFAIILIPWILIASRLDDIFDNLYTRIIHADKIVYGSIESHKLINPIRISDELGVRAFQQISDSISLILNFRDNTHRLDKIDIKGLHDLYTLENAAWIPKIHFSNDTINLYAFLDPNRRSSILSRRLTLKSVVDDTVYLEMQLLRGITHFPSGMRSFFGRDSTKHPKAILLDKKSSPIESIALTDHSFQNQTFDYVHQISDSCLVATTYELDDDLTTNYRVHILNYKSHTVLKSLDIFKRTDKYSLKDLPVFDIANDSTIIFAFHYPDKLKSQLWLVSVNIFDLKENWRKKIDIENDELREIHHLKCFNGNVYFTGTGELYLHKYWLTKYYFYNYLGSINYNGDVVNLKYLKRTPFYWTDLLGFYTLGNDIFALGRQSSNDEIGYLFTDNSIFRINVKDNLGK